MTGDVAIGKYIAGLRERADLKQAELARRLEWSATLLSRSESGERPLSEEEIDIVLRGIGTEEAKKAKEVLARRWQVLPEPPLDDPEADLLWRTELAAQQIRALSERPDVKQVFVRRLTRYEEELVSSSLRLMNRRYRMPFIGTIAAGKSTAICRVQRLEIPSVRGMPKPVLETGSGGITICEVHVQQGPQSGLIIEPCTEDELRRHVTDFANFLMNPAQPALADTGDGEIVSPGLSREVARALRNMTKLRAARSDRKPDGTLVRFPDEARALAETVGDVKSLVVELLARIELHKRDQRDIWHAADSTPALEWQQQNFERINNGRHEGFTLPKRIELMIPDVVLGNASVSVTIIDTQGIDDIAERADLEQHFDDPHTIIILCTKFEEAPANEIRRFMTRAKEAGVRTLESHFAILVLPRADEALKMKDNDGNLVEKKRDGYDLKADEIYMKLQPQGLAGVPVTFFNAADDDPDELRSFLLSRIEAVRKVHRDAVIEIIDGANALLANYEKEQAQETTRVAARRLNTWIENHATLGPPARRIQDSLLATVGAAHPRTIAASVVRAGDWKNLNYAHQLSHGAQSIASQLVGSKVRGFREIAENLLQDPDLAEAHDLVRQAVRLLEESFDQVRRKAQIVGQSVHADEMSVDEQFWARCRNERGQGYRDRINRLNDDWFKRDGHLQSQKRVTDMVTQGWEESVAQVRALLSPT